MAILTSIFCELLPATIALTNWSNRSSLAMQVGHRILLVKQQLALNIWAPKRHLQHLLYPFWRSAWSYKHKRVLFLVAELKGHPESKCLRSSDAFPQEKGPENTFSLSITSPLWTQSWCFTQREGSSVTQLTKGSMSCCRVPTGGNKPMLTSSLIHPTSP